MKTYPTQVEFSPSLAGGQDQHQIKKRQKYIDIIRSAVPQLVVPTTFLLCGTRKELQQAAAGPGHLVCGIMLDNAELLRPDFKHKFLLTFETITQTIFPQILTLGENQLIFNDQLIFNLNFPLPEFFFPNTDLFRFLTTGEDCVHEDPMFDLRNFDHRQLSKFGRYSKFASIGRTSYFYDVMFNILEHGRYMIIEP